MDELEPVIKVPLSHFNKLMTACCTLNNCLEEPQFCDCRLSIEHKDKENNVDKRRD